MATVQYFWYGFNHRGTTFMYLYHLLSNVWKVSYTISMSIFVYVPYLSPYSTDKFISCVVPSPSQWFFHFGDDYDNHMNSGENYDIWWYRIPSFFMTMQGLTPQLLSQTSCTTGNGRFWNIHCTYPTWVHAITISLPEWKNHCERPGKTQEVKLAMLAQMVVCLPLVQRVWSSVPGGLVNFHLKIFNLEARRGGDVHFLIARFYITGLD